MFFNLCSDRRTDCCRFLLCGSTGFGEIRGGGSGSAGDTGVGSATGAGSGSSVACGIGGTSRFGISSKFGGAAVPVDGQSGSEVLSQLFRILPYSRSKFSSVIFLPPNHVIYHRSTPHRYGETYSICKLFQFPTHLRQCAGQRPYLRKCRNGIVEHRLCAGDYIVNFFGRSGAVEEIVQVFDFHF